MGHPSFHSRSGQTELVLPYRPPADFAGVLSFLARRAVAGLEEVGPDSYVRRALPADGSGTVRVDFAVTPASGVRVSVPETANPTAVAGRVQHMFDLAGNPEAVREALGTDPRLQPLLAARPGLRIPGMRDGFEGFVRAVAGQFVSVAAATTFVSRIVSRHGRESPDPPGGGPRLLFPGPEELADADFSRIGLTRNRAETIRTGARALLDGKVSLSREQPLGEFVGSWTELRGIGPWTAHYLALRVLGHPDAFPAGDLVLRRMMADGNGQLTEAQLRQRAERWRPYRAYAALHLWHEAAAGG